MAISYKQIKLETLENIDNMKQEQVTYFNRVVACILKLKQNKHKFAIQKYYKILHTLHSLLYHYTDTIEFYQNWYNREIKA